MFPNGIDGLNEPALPLQTGREIASHWAWWSLVTVMGGAAVVVVILSIGNRAPGGAVSAIGGLALITWTALTCLPVMWLCYRGYSAVVKAWPMVETTLAARAVATLLLSGIVVASLSVLRAAWHRDGVTGDFGERALQTGRFLAPFVVPAVVAPRVFVRSLRRFGGVRLIRKGTGVGT